MSWCRGQKIVTCSGVFRSCQQAQAALVTSGTPILCRKFYSCAVAPGVSFQLCVDFGTRWVLCSGVRLRSTSSGGFPFFLPSCPQRSPDALLSCSGGSVSELFLHHSSRSEKEEEESLLDHRIDLDDKFNLGTCIDSCSTRLVEK